MPDTQQEVLNANDTRFINRSKWLVANKAATDLRWVASSGDVVNWDTPDHSQYKIASAAMVPLEQAKIPYTLTIGNHDTQATMSPRRSPGCHADPDPAARHDDLQRLLQRRALHPGRPGPSRRTRSTTSTPPTRPATAVDGAGARTVAAQGGGRLGQEVVASHPHHNVIIATHDYINGAGGLGTSAGYGDTSPQYLYDNLVKQYTNIKFVLCGHTGQAGLRVDTGVHGNKIISYNQTFHSNTTNPVRLIEVDTSARHGDLQGPRSGDEPDLHAVHHQSHRHELRQVVQRGARVRSRPAQ